MTYKIREAIEALERIEECLKNQFKHALEDVGGKTFQEIVIIREALKEIEEVDVDKLSYDMCMELNIDRPTCGRAINYLQQRGMLRAGVEPVEGLKDVLEKLSKYSGLDAPVLATVEESNILLDAARKYLAIMEE